jgi:hypothetical protein
LTAAPRAPANPIATKNPLRVAALCDALQQQRTARAFSGLFPRRHAAIASLRRGIAEIATAFARDPARSGA